MDLKSKEIFEASCLTQTFTGNVYLRDSSMGLLSLIAQFRLLVVELDEHLVCSWWLMDTEVTNNYFFFGFWMVWMFFAALIEICFLWSFGDANGDLDICSWKS
jgi:hypothetical protein